MKMRIISSKYHGFAAVVVFVFLLGSLPTDAFILPKFTTTTTSQNTPSSSSSNCISRSTYLNVASSSDSQVQVNSKVANVKVSKTVEVFGLVKQLEADGVEVTSLCVGEPDFPPPPAVLEATIAAVRNGDTTYTAVTGTNALRRAIARDLKVRKGVEYNPLTEIVVGNGAKQSVYQGILAICGEGDQVLIPAPYWPSYPEMVALAGADSVIVETKADTGYLMTPEQLRSTLHTNPNVKLLMLCNPSNPTGGVYTRKDLEGLATVLEDYPGVAVLADEIYERLVYPPTDSSSSSIPKDDWCPSFASIKNMFDRTLTVNGFSKAYAMTGYRLGYLAAPARLAKAVTTLQSQITSCAGSLSQAAGVAALTEVEESWLENNVVIMQEKRDYVLQELSNMPHVNIPEPPRGAFYVLPDVSMAPKYQGDDTQLCLDLLQQEKLALVPGSSFGAPGCVRLSYATSMEELQTAMTKMNRFMSSL